MHGLTASTIQWLWGYPYQIAIDKSYVTVSGRVDTIEMVHSTDEFTAWDRKTALASTLVISGDSDG